MAKKKSAKRLSVGESGGKALAGGKTSKPAQAKKKSPTKAPKKAAKKSSAAGRTKELMAGRKAVGVGKAGDKPPMNMVSNEPLVGKGKRDEPVPAIAKRVLTKTVSAGKSKRIRFAVRTGTAGGRPGGGGTGETSPTRDTAAGRGHGQKRTKR